MTSRTLGLVAARVAAYSDQVRVSVARDFIKKHPEDRVLLPQAPEHIFADLPRMLIWILAVTPADGVITKRTTMIMADAGREQRRLGIAPEHYDTIARAAAKTIPRLCRGIPHTMVSNAQKAILTAGLVARASAEMEQADGCAPYATATIVETERRCNRIGVVRAQLDRPWQWNPGQYMAISSPLIRGVWRYYSPAMPCDETGGIEFHIKSTGAGSTSETLLSASVGDTLLVGSPHGSLTVSDPGSGDTRDILMVAHSTGLAPMRANLLHLARFNNGDRRVHLFFGADYPGELYDLNFLWQLAAGCPWLSVTPVTLNPKDDFWVEPTDFCSAPRGLHVQQTGVIGEVVASYGTWEDRDILLAGSPDMITTTALLLTCGGTPENIIRHDPVA